MSILNMANSSIFISETLNNNDIHKSVFDIHNIIYLQDKIKNIGSRTNAHCSNNDTILPSFNSTWGIQESYWPDQKENLYNFSFQLEEFSLDLHTSSSLSRYEYPCCFDINKTDVMLYYSNVDNTWYLEDKTEYCIFCESKGYPYFDNDIVICRSDEICMKLHENKFGENDAHVSNTKLDSIIIEANQEANQCDFELVHTISEEFSVYDSVNSFPKNSNSKVTCIKEARVYKCKVCTKQFKGMTNLECHLRIHSNNRPYVCHFCKQAFKQSSHLVSHVRRHTGERPFKCPNCNDAFIQGTTLKIHIKKKHTDVKIQNTNSLSRKCVIKNFYCKYCKKTYLGVCKKEHLRTHVKKAYQCPTCPKKFKQRDSYEKHVKIHFPICGDFFNEGLKVRRQTKRGQEYKKRRKIKYLCKYCDKEFNSKSNLAVHYRIHTGERPYQCNLCLASFRQISHLKDHYGRHGSERPYVCSVCNIRFIRYVTAVNHIRNHHPSQKSFLVKTLENLKGDKAESCNCI